MHAEDRLIHFSTELIHAPVTHAVPALQKLYYELSQTRAAYDSSDFSMSPQYKFYSRRGPKTQSIALFLPDRVVLVEEWADMALSDFHAKVREVAGRMLDSYGIPVFIAHTVTLRSTFVLTHFKDARVFLLDHLCQQKDRIGPYFRRPIATGGLRFVLPQTPENPGDFHVTIESFRHSINEIFVEVKGVFIKQHITKTELDTAIENAHRVRTFITDNVFPYLDQYDSVAESEP